MSHGYKADIQEDRRCKNKNHPTTFVNKKGKCHKERRCPDKGKVGCLVK